MYLSYTPVQECSSGLREKHLGHRELEGRGRKTQQGQGLSTFKMEKESEGKEGNVVLGVSAQPYMCQYFLFKKSSIHHKSRKSIIGYLDIQKNRETYNILPYAIQIITC